MIAAFLGGGSLRLLPIFRGIFHDAPEVFRNGQIRLIDRKLERAQAVGRLIKACPEYESVQCEVIATSDIDEGFSGIDVLYLTMAALREPSVSQAHIAALEYGYITSDQLSVHGAFLSLRLGGLILDFARKLEKLSPKALMLIFPNPVSVYSCMVNRFTKIKALGICGGFNNHRFDLTRLCFHKDGFDPKWDVVAAGVNHLSFILRGKYDGEDLYGSLLPRLLTADWNPMDISRSGPSKIMIETALNDLYDMYKKYNTLIFSTELDGLAHISENARRLCRDIQKETLQGFEPENARVQSMAAEEEKFSEFIRMSHTPEKIDWSLSRNDGTHLYTRSIADISIPIFKALAGLEKMRIVASFPNYGVVKGLPDGASCEYTMDLFRDTMTPVEDQYIPAPFKGIVSSLSEFQTLNGEAIALQDPAKFAAALDAYPVNGSGRERKEFIRKMFAIYSDLDPLWKSSLDHLQ